MPLRKRKTQSDNLEKTSNSENQPNETQTNPAKKRRKNNRSQTVSELEPVVAENGFKIENYLLDGDWKSELKNELDSEYFLKLNQFLANAYESQKIKPPKELVFNAFNLTKLSDIKCVILGQDPYHDENQAHGLAFSVPANTDVPRSLTNIFKELKTDISNFEWDETLGGCLEKWTHQGVFLLNVFLTVELHKPGSHSKIGWQTFTDKVISLISEKNSGCAFLLWGKFAETKEKLIDAKKHRIIKSGHPSPLSFQHFVNCKCFSKTNDFLQSIGKAPINWSLK